MSAENYEVCPRCVERAGSQLESLMADYGKMPAAEFLARARVDEENHRTFEEHYEFYIEDGEVVCSYHGECTECHLGAEFVTRHPLSG